ncbi:amidohydrolase family protein [Rhodobacteraceae bacterium]|nr:amidohydrolase family protein [Paracoccaceae bacterium]
MKIDAHVHFWELGETHNIWSAKKIGGLQHDFTPEMLGPLCKAAGIDGVVVVQAATDTKETEYMVRLAGENDFIKGVIGWLDLESDPETLRAAIERQRDIPKLCGIRAHPPKEFDPSWFTNPAMLNSYRVIAAEGVPVDFLANCTQLGPIGDLFAAVPEMTAILNHGGRPFVMTGELTQWRADMKRIARDTSAYVKVSGLVERAGVEWQTDTLRPWVEAMIEDFGCERLIFSSNWPVMTLMSTYDLWWTTLNEIVEDAGVSAADRDMLFGGTAAKVYGLG